MIIIIITVLIARIHGHYGSKCGICYAAAPRPADGDCPLTPICEGGKDFHNIRNRRLSQTSTAYGLFLLILNFRIYHKTLL